jgi:GT2 family glycosyltransferase
VPPDAPLDVEVSLVNTNNRELLRSCLGSLLGACEGLRWHATVVDNASQDGSAEMVAADFPWAQVLRNEVRLGFSANHNLVLGPVIASRSARYVLVLNEDTELDPGSVGALVSHCDGRPETGIAGPAIRGSDARPQASLFRFPGVLEALWSTLRPRREPIAGGDGGWLNGSCLLIRTEALRQVGSLDDRFFIFSEDTDLAIRCRRAGWQSVLCDAAGIVHHGHQTVSQPALGSVMERQMVRSRYLYFRKHHGRGAAVLVTTLVRSGLLLRGVWALTQAAFRGGPSDQKTGALLLELARYNPRTVLPHEVAAGGR